MTEGPICKNCILRCTMGPKTMSVSPQYRGLILFLFQKDNSLTIFLLLNTHLVLQWVKSPQSLIHVIFPIISLLQRENMSLHNKLLVMKHFQWGHFKGIIYKKKKNARGVFYPILECKNSKIKCYVFICRLNLWYSSGEVSVRIGLPCQKWLLEGFAA